MRITGMLLAMLLSVVVLLLPHPSQAEQWLSPQLQEHPLVGQVIRTRDGAVLSQSELVLALAPVPYVLLGEKHDNADHHQLQQQLIRQLTNAQRPLVLEMLAEGQGVVAGQLTAQADEPSIRQALSWPERGWPWPNYGGQIQAALAQGGGVEGANLSRDEIMTLMQDPTAELAPRLASTDQILPRVEADFIEVLYEQHCEVMPREQLGGMARVQVARDASMAAALMRHGEGGVLLAGGFHVVKPTGVPAHLALAEQPSVSVLMLEVAEDLAAWQAYGDDLARDFDYLYFTPRAEEVDYCAALKEKHGHTD